MPHRKPFVDFINDFSLLNSEDVVMFDATLKVIVEDMEIEARSEIHIVTSIPNSFCTLYLLHQDSRINDLPTMFESDKTTVEYLQNQSLKIDTKSLMNEKAIIYIIPDKE